MFTTFISIVLSIAINLFDGAYSVSLDTCENVYYNSDIDCMVSVMVDSDTGAKYTIVDYCAGRASQSIIMRCNECGRVVYAVTLTSFSHLDK